MTILTLHGEYFVEGEKAVAETLFKPLNGKTASGHYTRHKGRVMFYKANGELFAAFIYSRALTSLVTASKDSKGKVWYMQSICSLDAQRFGLDVMNTRQCHAFEQSLLPFVK